MLLTKYKIQELVENVKIDMDEVEIKAAAFVEENGDDSVALVRTAIEILKDKIIDELGRF